MNSVVHALGVAIDALRTVFFATGVALTALCTVEWAARTHRLNAFSTWARTARRLIARPLKFVERRVVRAGGNPVSAQWWMLVAFFVIGILVLSTFDFLRAQLADLSLALDGGPRGVLRFTVNWAFTLMYLAIWIPIIASILQLNPFSPVVRAARVVSEPLLRPIRRLIPPFGGFDISPLVLYAALAWIVKPLVMRAL